MRYNIVEAMSGFHWHQRLCAVERLDLSEYFAHDPPETALFRCIIYLPMVPGRPHIKSIRHCQHENINL